LQWEQLREHVGAEGSRWEQKGQGGSRKESQEVSGCVVGCVWRVWG
jgi:hypothetical protein